MNVEPISLFLGLALGFLLRTTHQSININASSNARVDQPNNAQVEVKDPSEDETLP